MRSCFLVFCDSFNVISCHAETNDGFYCLDANFNSNDCTICLSFTDDFLIIVLLLNEKLKVHKQTCYFEDCPVRYIEAQHRDGLTPLPPLQS